MKNTKMSYEEYKDAVRRKLQESDWHYSEEMADRIISHDEAFVRKSYEAYIDPAHTAIEIGFFCG